MHTKEQLEAMNFEQKCIDLISAQIERRKRSKNREVKFIDLFAGLGGIRLGFENAFREKGFEPKCVLSSEIKDYAIKVYKNYYKDTEGYGDITQIPATDIEDFDFLLAGFPCQPFSAAGLQACRNYSEYKFLNEGSNEGSNESPHFRISTM